VRSFGVGEKYPKWYAPEAGGAIRTASPGAHGGAGSAETGPGAGSPSTASALAMAIVRRIPHGIGRRAASR
jgi:hypothetical protein